MKIAFVGFAVPEMSHWAMSGSARAGNLAQNGFIEALYTSGAGLDIVWSFQPIEIWPNSKVLFAKGERTKLSCGMEVRICPLFNFPILREIFRIICFTASFIFWVLKNIRHPRVLIVYNIYFPPAFFLRLLTWITHTKMVAILYDLGKIKANDHRWSYRIEKYFIRLAYWCIPRFDGRILISEAIERDFASGRHYILVDGGVTNMVTDRLFDVLQYEGDEFRLMFAGGINEWNHIEAMLSFMARNHDFRLRLWLAGGGGQVGLVEKAVARDSRIKFFGRLGHDELFKLYEQSDCLLNLRDMLDPALAYHYPSKLLEILTVGKPVITSNTNHTRKAYGHICRVIDDIGELDVAVAELMSMSPEKRCDFGRKAREWMLANKTWRAQGPAIREYIEKHVV